MNKRFSYLVFLLVIVFHTSVNSQSLSPEARVSVLTCNPGEEVYSMYGHTAIRVNDPTQNLDIVFNYGVFSFESNDFLYRFAKGQTDYRMDGGKFLRFLPEYEQEKRSVYEQVLNLSVEGKNKLFQALIENFKPENRVYRYNFFMDNCATRVRDMIEQNAGVPISFPDNNPTESYRQLIKQYHHSFRWFDFGIDLLVGKKADVPVSAYGQMFLPEYLMNQFGRAKITVDGKSMPLVLETRTLLEYPNSKQNSDLPWPTIVFGLFFLLVLALSIRAYRQNKSLTKFDLWLFGISGVAGLIIGWFTLYSEHPAMSPNFNLLWAFPLNVIFVALSGIQKLKAILRYYLVIPGLLLIGLLLSGQQFNPAVYFIGLTLLVRIVFALIQKKH